MTETKGLATVSSDTAVFHVEPETKGDAIQVMAMIQQGIKSGLGPAEIREMVELLKQVKRWDAELEFAAQLADFQAHAPDIIKAKHVRFVTKAGALVEYDQFTAEALMDAIRQPLADRGFSIGFSSTLQGVGVIVVKCVLRHRNGHSTESELPMTTTSGNPGMSDQQKWIGARTFAKRYVLVDVLGLSITEPDDLEREADPTPITAEQKATLRALIEEVKADLPRLLNVFGVRSIDELPQTNYAPAVNLLQAKRKGARP